MEDLLTDIEGNRYKTVKIGNQIWMSENLRVSHYNNGQPVLVSKNKEQCRLHLTYKESAVYISEEDSSNYLKYGLLYSPNILFNKQSIAPSGWHIPSLEEWKELVDFLGGNDNAGRKLKSKNGWKRESNQPSTYQYNVCEFGGTDDFGFSALPSGMMQTHYPNAFDVGMYAHYWAADQQKVSNRTTWFGYFTLNYYKGNVEMGCSNISSYYAIRCVKDR